MRTPLTMTLADQFDRAFDGDARNVPPEVVKRWFEENDPGMFVEQDDDGTFFCFSDGSTLEVLVVRKGQDVVDGQVVDIPASTSPRGH